VATPASRGLFITLGGCSEEAKQLTDKHGIEVVNETGLASMLVATEARFDPATLQILRDPRFIFTQTRGAHRAMRLIAIFGRSFFCGAPGVLRPSAMYFSNSSVSCFTISGR
jgi:hypothetical protein